MPRKKKDKEKYLYVPEKFCVPVTKIGPLAGIKFLIDDFIAKRVTFCVDGEDDRCEIWRMEEKNDADKIKKKEFPKNPKILYVKGKKTEYQIK